MNIVTVTNRMKRMKWEILFRWIQKKTSSVVDWCTAKAACVAVRESRPALRLRWPQQMLPHSSFPWEGAEKPGAGGLKYRCGKRDPASRFDEIKEELEAAKEIHRWQKIRKGSKDILWRTQIFNIFNSRLDSNAAINAELNLTFVYQCLWYHISACLHKGSTFSNLTLSNIVCC